MWGMRGMAFTASEKIKPIWDFVVQVVVGAALFTVVFLVAFLIAVVVKWINSTGVAPYWLVRGAGYGEMGLFAVDLFCFALFLLNEILKLMRSMDWKAA
jgi:hypothetical protein